MNTGFRDKVSVRAEQTHQRKSFFDDGSKVPFSDSIDFDVMLRIIFHFDSLIKDSDSKKYWREELSFKKFFTNNPLVDIDCGLSILHDNFEEFNVFDKFLPVWIILIFIEFLNGCQGCLDDVGIIEVGNRSGNLAQQLVMIAKGFNQDFLCAYVLKNVLHVVINEVVGSLLITFVLIANYYQNRVNKFEDWINFWLKILFMFFLFEKF